MLLTLHLCMPSGDGSRASYQDALELVQADNRRVIRAMLNNGDEIPDTVGEWGLAYAPEQRRANPQGQPLMDVYGLGACVERGYFSCGCAAAIEAAILEEKYGVAALATSVPQADNDFHAVVVSELGVHDPVLNFQRGLRHHVPSRPKRRVKPQSCEIGPDGRVHCEVPATCYVDPRGRWHCPDVPGLSDRRESIASVHRSPGGQQWARMKNGAVAPLRRR